MTNNWYFIFGIALIESFVISVFLTGIIRRVAIRLNIVDHPGDRKMHHVPKPLLGGVAIYVTFNAVILGNLFLLEPAGRLGVEWLELNVLPFLGENTWRPLLGVMAGGFIIFMLGVVDDIKALTPEVKLAGQISAGIVLVLSGIRLDLFLEPLLRNVWLLDTIPETRFAYLTTIVSSGATIFWVVLMTNSMNFLDNMDGLCGGVSGIAALSFFFCLLPHQEYFVCALLMVFAGSVAGFLYHNLNPARIFMGDAGAMFCGYILATVAVMGTFYTESISSRVAVAAPLLALCVPLFDTITVIFIRWRNNESIMKGDKRHFSHRLVEGGMSPRQAVEFIFLVAAITGMGGVLLGQVDRLGTIIILTQTVGIFLLILLLMKIRKT